MAYKILIAEDNYDIMNILKIYLESNQYQVVSADNGEDALKIVETDTIDLVILDIMMPKMDGFELTKKIREFKTIPIIILTAKVDDTDSILGLNLGADDYLTKPFNPLVVVARVSAQLRRYYSLGGDSNISNSIDTLKIGDLELNTKYLTLKKADKEIMLTPIEFKLLNFMMKSPGRVYTKAQLCEAVNGEYFENYENAIMVHISHLRDKIEDDSKNPQYIKNIRGIGYKIEDI